MAETDNTIQDWGEAYLELSELILEKVPGVKHLDLYYGQEQAIDSDGNWLPFPAPAVFLAFNAADVADLGNQSQQLTMDITVYLAFETVQDSSANSLGRKRSMEFIGLLRQLHKALHNTSGKHFSPLSRTGLNRVEAPPYMIFYSQTYRCVILDHGAVPQWEEVDTPPLSIEGNPPPPEVDPNPLFIIPTR